MLRVPYDKTYAYMQDSTGEYINEQVVLFGPYQQETWQIAYNPEKLDAVETVAVFQYNRIGVEIDTLPDFYLTSAFAGRMREQVRHYTNVADAFEAMRNGEVSAVMGLRLEVDHELAKWRTRHSRLLAMVSRASANRSGMWEWPSNTPIANWAMPLKPSSTGL